MPAGWYHAHGDPPGTVRYWDGTQWLGAPEADGSWSRPAPLHVMIEPAGPWERIGARVIDGLLWLIALVAVTLPVMRNFFGAAGDPDLFTGGGLLPFMEDIQRQFIVAGLIGTALIVAYETIMNGFFSGTFGKQLVGIEVVETNGEPIGPGRALLRMVPLIALQLITVAGQLGSVRINVFWLVALVGLIMLFADRRRQTPWDKVAGTIVIA